jgi:hypothetical protein
MVIADRISKSFVKQVERMGGSFVRGRNGLWRGRLAGLPLHGVELSKAYKAGPSERSLYMFTRAFLKDPRALVRMKELDEEELHVYCLLYQHVEQFRRNPMTMDLKDLDLANKKLRKVYLEIAESMTLEERLKGLTPEQRFAGLTPEQIAAALPPEAVALIVRKAKVRKSKS